METIIVVGCKKLTLRTQGFRVAVRITSDEADNEGKLWIDTDAQELLQAVKAHAALAKK